MGAVRAVVARDVAASEVGGHARCDGVLPARVPGLVERPVGRGPGPNHGGELLAALPVPEDIGGAGAPPRACPAALFAPGARGLNQRHTRVDGRPHRPCHG
ncbi:hypothetical protein TPA0910_84550 [Streptomyces hygroscopicus subsp. sporocinereus]|uniref:Uncharacterized protein n=1 Tax=Streptomyces hygroscopicus TaxID=1912 RepID=A0ABQ3UEI2_STRHY|nr:hypothetical protein TPA0910_84550 [Streptomyces hygroscopicus]